MAGISHTALPEEAQDKVLQALGITDNGPKKFIYKPPKGLTGFVVLSPVNISITDANGKTVSKDTNDFEDDAFVDVSEEEGEDDPKIIVLQNLPAGTYTVHLTGTGTGPYTIIVTHSDENSDSEKTLTGTTTLGKEETFTVTITDDGMDVSNITSSGPSDSGGFTPSERSESRGDEQDCCPGHDVVQKKAKGKVLGASTKNIKSKKGPVTLEELKPLNEIFFSVYGRLPTFEEWKYWVKRYSTDKRDWEKIRGAMAWQKTHRPT